MKGVILHGGHGTRLRPLTHTGPKQLIPVANKPISQYVLEDLVKAGIAEIAIILGDLYSEKVKEHYGDGRTYGAKISYINQGEPKGIAQAVGLCKEYVGNEPFVVYLGDNLLRGGIKEFADNFKTSNYDIMILLCKVAEPQQFGVAKFDTEGKLIGLLEKPKQPPSNYALTGIWFFTPIIFDIINELKPSCRGELEITEAIQLMISKGYKVGYDFVTDWWKDTGTPGDILDANRLILDELKPGIKGTVEDEESLQGRVLIGQKTTIKAGVLIRGPTIIGENCLIENTCMHANGVYIGPYTSIGNNVIIRHGEIENSIIMDDCLIDVDERIVDSLIASNSKITSSKNNKPNGRRFILGERSRVEL